MNPRMTVLRELLKLRKEYAESSESLNRMRRVPPTHADCAMLVAEKHSNEVVKEFDILIDSIRESYRLE